MVSRRRGQASLEMAVAMFGAILLLLGSIKIFVWMAQRLVARQQSYDSTRKAAASDAAPGQRWNEPSQKLSLFGN